MLMRSWQGLNVANGLGYGQRRTMEQRSDCRRRPGVDYGGRGKPGATQLPFQRPEGATDQQAQARRNPLGRLPPEPGRQRTPLLPVQCSGGYPVGDPRGRLRWRIETEFETEKSDVGLDEYETRTWAGWHHHVALCLLGGAFLLSLQQAWGEKDAPDHEAAGLPGGAGNAAPRSVDDHWGGSHG